MEIVAKVIAGEKLATNGIATKLRIIWMSDCLLNAALEN